MLLVIPNWELLLLVLSIMWLLWQCNFRGKSCLQKSWSLLFPDGNSVVRAERWECKYHPVIQRLLRKQRHQGTFRRIFSATVNYSRSVPAGITRRKDVKCCRKLLNIKLWSPVGTKLRKSLRYTAWSWFVRLWGRYRLRLNIFSVR